MILSFREGEEERGKGLLLVDWSPDSSPAPLKPLPHSEPPSPHLLMGPLGMMEHPPCRGGWKGQRVRNAAPHRQQELNQCPRPCLLTASSAGAGRLPLCHHILSAAAPPTAGWVLSGKWAQRPRGCWRRPVVGACRALVYFAGWVIPFSEPVLSPPPYQGF